MIFDENNMGCFLFISLFFLFICGDYYIFEIQKQRQAPTENKYKEYIK